MKRSVRIFISFTLFLLMGFLLYWRYRVGMTRFFDVDEFTHLHWAAQMSRAERPYIDFFTFFTPGFHWALQPIFWLVQGQQVFLLSRLLAFSTFVGIVAVVGLLFGQTRGWRWAMMPAVILAFLPMPYDKFLEVRPDNLATLFGLAAMLFQVRWLQTGNMHAAWVAGILYAICLLVLVKMLPFAVVGLAIAWFVPKGRGTFFAAFAAPLIVFLVWLVSLGDWSTVWYSLTNMPVETNGIGKLATMEPHLFFFPNGAFYGAYGLTQGLMLNHALWIAGLLMGVYRLFSPFVTADGKRRQTFVEILIAGIFILSVAGYIKFFPLKHAQYLIPIAVFIAYYGADLLILIGRKLGSIGSGIAVCIGAYLLCMATVSVNEPKLLMNNQKQLADFSKLEATIGMTDEVFDLDGRLITRTDPYYVCCLSMGLFLPLMSRPPQPISEVLEARRVPYIYQGESGRLWQLGSDLPYIQSHYEKVPGWSDALWKRK